MRTPATIFETDNTHLRVNCIDPINNDCYLYGNNEGIECLNLDNGKGKNIISTVSSVNCLRVDQFNQRICTGLVNNHLNIYKYMNNILDLEIS